MTLYDPKTTALIIIDLQSRQLGYSLAPHPAEQLLGHGVALAEALRAAGSVLTYVKVAFAENFADALSQPVDMAMTRPEGAKGSDGADYTPRLDHLPPDFWITKHQWGAFHGTELDLQLRRRGIRTVILTGIATNMGVEQTAREAWQLGYAVILAEDAISSIKAEMHTFAMENVLPRIARIRSSAAILANKD